MYQPVQKLLAVMVAGGLLVNGYCAFAVAQEAPDGTCTPSSSAPPKPEKPKVSENLLDAGVLESDEGFENGLEIQGLIVDQTVTKFGRNFFDAFMDVWKPLPGVQFDLHIGELFDPLRGSLIRVMLNDAIVYEGFISPRYEEIKELAKSVSKDTREIINSSILQSMDEEF